MRRREPSLNLVGQMNHDGTAGTTRKEHAEQLRMPPSFWQATMSLSIQQYC